MEDAGKGVGGGSEESRLMPLAPSFGDEEEQGGSDLLGDGSEYFGDDAVHEA
jgi:hypothetical protein